MAKKENSLIKEPRINGELRNYDVVRLVYKENSEEKSENDFSRIVSIKEAFELSKKYSLDLIEINDKTNPPVVRLYEYNKYMFEQKKAAKNKKKNTVTCKEVQLSVNISDHDLNIKVNKAKEFINNGDKVKVVLTIKGRNLGRREQSSLCFYKFIDNMSDVAVPESLPRDEGNKVIVILKKK